MILKDGNGVLIHATNRINMIISSEHKNTDRGSDRSCSKSSILST